MTFPAFDHGDLLDIAERRTDEVHVTASGPATGVALPDWVQPGAVLDVDRARKLGAQLLLAAHEHEAIQDAALEPPVARRARAAHARRRVEMTPVGMSAWKDAMAAAIEPNDPVARWRLRTLMDAVELAEPDRGS